MAMCAPAWAAAEQKKAPPNIIIILSDDMGYSDLGCYGGEIRTPHLDQLAAEGLRFTQFYNTGRCCPTRASLLTGLSPHQAGVGHMTEDHGYDGYRGALNNHCVTIAEVMRTAGYRTYACGKWHVSAADKPDSDNSAWPLQRGFEKYYGTIRGAGNFYDPAALCRGNRFITPVNDPEYKPEHYYYTDAITDNAIQFIQQHAKETPDKPFFFYVAYTAAHWPMQAPEEEIAKYKGKYDGGYEPIRAARLARLKELGLLPAGAELSPQFGEWDKVENKAWEARCMEVYAAMITRMDRGIGRIVDELKAEGRLDNTLILFLQDNGGCGEETGRKSNGPGPEKLKPRGPDELQLSVTPPMFTREGKWVRSGPGVMPGPADTYVAYGKAWANVSDTPFREYKHFNHEGGISTPLIAHWPAGIPAERRGKLETQPGQLMDLMATCVDLGGAKYPTEFQGNTITPAEGTSLAPAFTGAKLGRTKPLVWEHEGNRAIREDQWKLVAKENKPWELYDINADRSELHDLASSEPEMVKRLAADWDAWAKRAQVLPMEAWRANAKGALPKAGAARLSNTRRFELKSGDSLERGEAPAVGKSPFRATVAFDASGQKEGVLLAQGGSKNGYALYLEDGHVVFSVRRDGDIVTIQGDAVPIGTHTAIAGIDAAGLPNLRLDDHAATAEKVTKGFLPVTPGEALDVGADNGSSVGPYAGPNEFKGKLNSVLVELLPGR